MSRVCLETLCEIAVRNPQVATIGGGISAIIRALLTCQQRRVNESLVLTLLLLINTPETRRYIRGNVDIEVRV